MLDFLTSNRLFRVMAFFKSSTASPTTVTPSSFRRKIANFRRKIASLLVQSGLDDKKFLPESSVSQLITEENVSALLRGASPGLVQFVCHRARRVFLTVLWSCDAPQLISVIESFRQHELTDNLFPIEDITINGKCRAEAIWASSSSSQQEGELECTHDAALNVFHDDPWESCTVGRFHQNQWMFSSPVFKKTDFKQTLDAGSILPFTSVSKECKEGHFSTVFEAKLRADHQDEFPLESGGEIHVAVKELKNLSSEPGYSAETAWELEAKALDQISQLRHQHLIRRIAAFKRGRKHYIMFEWADGGNIREVWAENRTEHRNLNGDRIMDFLEQFHGLAGALCALHNTNPKTKTGIFTSTNMGTNTRTDTRINTRTDSPPASVVTASAIPTIEVDAPDDNDNDDDDSDADSGGSSVTEHWRHGDLKPDNILKFKGSTWLGTLKIADLGLAKQHKYNTSCRDAPTDTRYTTLHYEAPEVITKSLEPRSRRYDIWSMGCIILESIIWLLYGYDVLDTFYKEQKHINDTSTETLYFIASKSQRRAGVSDVASSWMEQILKEDPECNKPTGTAIGDLLKLVQNKLLVVPLPDRKAESLAQCRIDASTLRKELGVIWAKARDNSSYLFTGTSRASVPIPKPLGQKKRDLLSVSTTSGHQHRPLETNRSATPRNPLNVRASS